MKIHALLGVLLLSHAIWAVPPRLVYDGTVLTRNGAGFTGTAQFKFALVSGDGAQTLWSNDGTSVGGREPNTAVSASVKAGAVGIMLGVGMNEVPSSIGTRNDLKLRVWIDIGQGFEMFSPDQEQGSVLWAFRAQQADSVPDGSITASKFSPDAFAAIPKPKLSYLWTPDESTALLGLEAHSVNIGTKDHIGSLYLSGAIGVKGAIELGDSSVAGINGSFIDFHAGFGRPDEDFNVRLKNDTDRMLTIHGGGLIVEHSLLLLSDQEFGGADRTIRFGGIGRVDTARELTLQSGDGTPLYLNPFHGGEVVVGSFSGNRTLRVEGITQTKALEITGGADFSERFTPFQKNEEIEPGSVVSYAHDGSQRILLATEEYDTKVAGVVSGADGINVGMTGGISMGQTGTLADGPINVAMVGRVRCRADASFAPIRVGDLLTTSPTPGCAMKATDKLRAIGSVIGKATSNLDSGKGWVWVHVTSR